MAAELTGENLGGEPQAKSGGDAASDMRRWLFDDSDDSSGSGSAPGDGDGGSREPGDLRSLSSSPYAAEMGT